MDKKLLVKVVESSPYSRHIHMELMEAEKGYAEMSMKIKPCHGNVHGYVHGGAIASLADQAGMMAIKSMLPCEKRGITIQMDIHYLAPVQGERLLAVGQVQKMGKHLAFSDVELKDEKEKTVALARCTIAIVEEEEDRVQEILQSREQE